MTAKRAQKSRSKLAAKRAADPMPPWRRILLTLSLVPLIIGVLLIFAWAMEWDVLNSMENQLVVGTLFLFFSFAASNALQGKWSLAAGWSLIMVADWLILTGVAVWMQVVGFILGAAGLVLVGIHYVRGIRPASNTPRSGN